MTDPLVRLQRLARALTFTARHDNRRRTFNVDSAARVAADDVKALDAIVRQCAPPELVDVWDRLFPLI